MTSILGAPNAVAIAFFLLFIALSLGITVWASRKTRTTEHFYAAGRSVTAFQNGLALAGDYMSAASFLGIAGLVALSGVLSALFLNDTLSRNRCVILDASRSPKCSRHDCRRRRFALPRRSAPSP